MARTVADAAALLLGARRPGRSGSGDGEARAARPTTRPSSTPDGLRGARIGVARHLAGFHDRVDRLFDEALDAMRDLGAELVDPVEIQHVAELEEPELEVLYYEFKTDLEAYLQGLGPAQPYRTLADLIGFNVSHADVELPYFGQEHFEKAAEKGPLTEPRVPRGARDVPATRTGRGPGRRARRAPAGRASSPRRTPRHG